MPFDKDPDETYLAHAQRLLEEMDIEDEEGKPTWLYDLIVALAASHSVHVLREHADRLARFCNKEFSAGLPIGTSRPGI